jgi:carboxymethylenebutenolidase
MSQTIQLTAADGVQIPAYVARPTGKPKGALVVLQEIFGVNVHIRAVTDGFAQDGYLSIAPDMFQRVQPGVSLNYTEADLAIGYGYMQKASALPLPGIGQDVQAAIDYAARESGGKVGVVGYCWGGNLSWRSACGLNGLSAAVCYYGGGITTTEQKDRTPKVPVMMHFGDQDTHIPMDGVRAFEKQHSEVELHVYAAGHGFNCNLRDSWNAAASKVARERTLAFWAKHVG